MTVDVVFFLDVFVCSGLVLALAWLVLRMRPDLQVNRTLVDARRKSAILGIAAAVALPFAFVQCSPEEADGKKSMKTTMPLPKKFRSDVTVQINSPGIDPGTAPNRPYLENQLKIINSKRVFEAAAASLPLEKIWNLPADKVLEKLDKVTTAEIQGDTNLIKISCVDKDPQLAVDLVKTVAKSFKKVRTEDELRISNTALETLQKKLKEQEAKVEKNRLEMNELIKKYRIVDVEAFKPGSPDKPGNKEKK